MGRRPVIGGLLLVAVGVILGTTVFRDDIAHATGLAQSVSVSNTPSNPVPVQVQNVDGNGNIKVHEQGTPDVNVINTNTSPVPVANVSDAQSPYHFFGGDDVDLTNSSGDCSTADSAVPDGKRFVVETLTIDINYSSTTIPVTRAWFGWIGSGTLFNENEAVYLVPLKTATAGSTSYFEATQDVRVYVPAGRTPTFCFNFGSSYTGGLSWTATAWGYLVNAS